MSNTKNTLTSEENTKAEYNLNKRVLYVVGFCFCFLVTFVSSCTMHSNAYEPDLLKEQTERARANAESNISQSKAIKELINDGVNPIAARCAIEGWNNSNSNDVAICTAAGNK